MLNSLQVSRRSVIVGERGLVVKALVSRIGEQVGERHVSERSLMS